MGSVVYIVILFTGLILYFLSVRARKQQTFPLMKREKKEDSFDLMAWYLYGVLRRSFLHGKAKHSFLELLFQAPQVKRDLRALKPGVKTESFQTEYYARKIKCFLLLLYAGDLLALLVHISSMGAGVLQQGRLIQKNPYGQGESYANVRIQTEDGMQSQELQLTIDENVYSPQELNSLYESAVQELEHRILGENESTEKIKSNVKLPGGLEGYPFSLKWQSSDYFLMDHRGVIQREDISPGGETLVLTCTFSYRDWEREYQLPLLLFPPDWTPEEVWARQVAKTLEQSKVEQLYEKEYVLPEEIGGQKVVWEEVLEDYSGGLLALVLFAGICIYLLQDKDLHQKTEERNLQMLREYPVLVNRLTLYLGAGMAMKSAWNKIAMEYRGKRQGMKFLHYTYEEMLYTCYEMQSGVAEGEAYERFGKRCALQPYTRLTGLLNQSLKKGNGALLSDLQKEAADAQEERRSLARKKGEEAGTKLLLPMMMMLGIVMVLIMVPAFLSFTM